MTYEEKMEQRRKDIANGLIEPGQITSVIDGGPYDSNNRYTLS